MTDNIARTIAALRTYVPSVDDVLPCEITRADVLAVCDAAEAGLRCPPREPTQAMLDAGTIVYLREQQSRIPKWEPAIAARFWRAMYNEWINEGGQDAATLMGRGADAGEVTSADPVPPSPNALVRRFHCFGQEDGVYESATGSHVNYSDYARLTAELAEARAECERLRAANLEKRSALQELRIRLHASGRRPEECYEMSLIDNAINAERKQP